MDITWTPEEFAEFKRLWKLSGSANQMDRIDSRIEMPKFMREHGKEKCDAMHAALLKKVKVA